MQKDFGRRTGGIQSHGGRGVWGSVLGLRRQLVLVLVLVLVPVLVLVLGLVLVLVWARPSPGACLGWDS